MSKTALEAPRSDIYNVRFDNRTIAIRMIEDPAHPDYDPRVELPVDPELMESIRSVGMLLPAIGYKAEIVDGCQAIQLVVGRQRWKAIRAIWLDMESTGQDMSMAPAFKLILQKNEDAGKRRQKRIIENRHRQELSGLSLAKELANHLEIVGTDDEAREQARITFNFKSIAAMDNCLALLDTTPKVQALVTDGVLSPTAALQLAHQTADVQDRVADRIEAECADELDESDSDDEGGVDPAQIDAFPSEASAPAPERSSTPRQIPVSGVKEMIREETGKQAFALVTLKQIEKQIERKESDLEKALTKLEQCPTSNYATDYQKTVNQSAKVAEIQGEIKTLRWARGETVASGSDAASAGNDKMSAAWDILREALFSNSWPKVLDRNDFEWPELPRWDSVDQENETRREAAMAVNRDFREKIDASHLLVIAGEKVARRGATSDGMTFDLQIDTDSKWFTRIMDPFGKPSQLVRDWGAHGYLESHGKAGTVPTFKSACSELCKGRTVIQIKRGDFLAKFLHGSPLSITSTEQEGSGDEEDQ